METEQSSQLKKAVCYVRLSADDSKNPSLSPINQEKICKQYAEQNKDKISVIYRDVNRSGANMERPAFQRMLYEAKKKQLDRIYIKDWSRLTRDISDLREIKKKLIKELGIEIFSADGVSDDKAVDINTLSSDWFVQECRKKQEQHHKLKLEEGVPLNRPPLGYKMSKRYKMYMPDPEKANTVKEIFQMKSKGLTIKEIVSEMRMNFTTVYNIIQNRTYLGFNCYKGQWYKGKHEPLIDEETFNKCQNPIGKYRRWKNSKPIREELK